MTPVLWLALTVAALGLKDKPASPVLKANGSRRPGPTTVARALRPPTVRYTGPGDRWVMFLEGKEIDEEKRSFEVIMTPAAGDQPDDRDARGGATFRGIYKIEKDTLTICMRHGLRSGRRSSRVRRVPEPT